ncbi:acyltransferase family protein [Actinoplanes sp. NPDC049596]|uniref:acyltransferase family protein n=1 Tax=unclassified Actinoplanes TaxID=2626549 RepID=UPI00341B26C4
MTTSDTRTRQSIPGQREPLDGDVAGPSAGKPSAHPGFRPDIEGLRAIAVTLVVLGHAGLPFLAGGYVGVDVFFVISGFLITTLLLKELTRSGRISLARFYARRAARLLPASTLVVVATLVASWLWLPPNRFKGITLDALFSTFYGINYRLAAIGTDYLNASAPPSPLQHLWSLAVEEQFYLVWPLLLGGVWAWRKRRRPIAIALGLVIVVSLAVSVYQSSSAAPWAYFGAHTRAYELGIGALIALAARYSARLPKVAGGVLAGLGLAAIVAAALLYNDDTTFPGYAALLPVLGTAAVIAGGTTASIPVLRSWPFQQVGKLSYAWYLWHWPVLMIGPSALGLNASTKVKLALAAGSLVLAYLSFILVENPVRNRAWIKLKAWRGVGLGLVLSGSAAALALIASNLTPPLPTGPAAVDTIGVVASSADPQKTLTDLITKGVAEKRVPSNMTPTVEKALPDVPRVYPDGCSVGYFEVEQKSACVYGDPNGAKSIYLIGDSHGAQWFPAVDAIAKKRGVRFVSLTKSGCLAPSVTIANKVLKRTYTECSTWRSWVIAKIQRDKPDMVIMASNGSDEGGLVDAAGKKVPAAGPADDALWVAGWQSTWKQLAAPGRKLVVFLDTPWPWRSAPDCAAENPRDLVKCGRPSNKAFYEPARRAAVAAAAKKAGATVVDPAPWFCVKGFCPVVVGNVLVYKDFSHISTYYARTLVPLLDPKIPAL